MPTVRDIYNYIDSFAPYNAACSWDNTGLSVGDENAEVEKIAFALDITSSAIDFAKSQNADLIITHHPLIFKPIKELHTSSLCYKAVQSGIAHISAHTNFDVAERGVNTFLAEKLNLEIKNVIVNDNVCLYICESKEEKNLLDFVKFVKETLGGTVRFNDVNIKVKTIAVCSGAGADYLNEAKKYGADALLTGDGGHHDFLDANEMDIALICAGHFETENPAVDFLMGKIESQFGVRCIRAPQKTPITTL